MTNNYNSSPPQSAPLKNDVIVLSEVRPHVFLESQRSLPRRTLIVLPPIELQHPISSPLRTLNLGQRKTLATAANLANLLPTGTVLVFQALIPSFSHNGECLITNKYLTLFLIIVCSIACILSSFTDSFRGSNYGKIYHGRATIKGMYVFNRDDKDCDCTKGELEKYKIKLIDFVHAFASVIVFLVFAISSDDVQKCFFEKMGKNINQLVINLPLGVGIFASFLFTLFPTTRRGIGYGDHHTTK